MHPLLNLLATQPQLLADHVEAYAELAAAEAGEACGIWKRRALLYAAALCSLGVAAVLAGVALMLWAVTPAVNIHSLWALFAGPLLPAAFAAGCLVAANARNDIVPFETLRQQLRADITMLREAGTP